jgi:hypothetical protein
VAVANSSDKRQARRSIDWAAMAGRLNHLATGDSRARF